MILETAVERARVWACRVGWQGVTTQRVGTRKEEQRSQTARQARNRVRSGLTQWVTVIEGANL